MCVFAFGHCRACPWACHLPPHCCRSIFRIVVVVLVVVVVDVVGVVVVVVVVMCAYP